MNRVFVNQDVLRWAVDRAGRGTADIARFPKLPQWESGVLQPTMRQLEELAKATLTPFGYFFLPKPPEEGLGIPHFRTAGAAMASLPSPELIHTVRTMERRQAWMREYRIDAGQDPLAYVGTATVGDDPRLVAHDTLRLIGLKNGWAADQPNWSSALRAFIGQMEAAGVLVMISGIVENNTHRKLDVGEFRGFVLADEYAPLMFVNGADGKAAQMFTLAHELAHVRLGSSAAFDLRELQPADNRVEQACNRIAAEFLVPEADMRTSWESVRTDANRFDVIARQFKISGIVAARRALDLNLISRAEFFEFYRAYQEDERRLRAKPSGGGDFYLTQNARIGRSFAEAVVRAAGEGKLLYRDAYQLTGLYGNAFDQFARQFRYDLKLGVRQ